MSVTKREIIIGVGTFCLGVITTISGEFIRYLKYDLESGQQLINYSKELNLVYSHAMELWQSATAINKEAKNERKLTETQRERCQKIVSKWRGLEQQYKLLSQQINSIENTENLFNPFRPPPMAPTSMRLKLNGVEVTGESYIPERCDPRTAPIVM